MHDILKQWAEAQNSGDPERVTSLYAEHATLLPTLWPVLCTTPSAIDDYFRNRLQQLCVRVEIDEDTVVVESLTETLDLISGLYTFSFDTDAGRGFVPARFSFVVDRSLERPILHHHSSAVPQSA
ncbi:MAG: DUF4440 domain-containing protein [Verrucomicrobia bacterium]|nr:DUF4440 domain-containing protein [Verrucomicrobiota bacterium]MDA1088616.1 DUF4440 domain-containing protein [Verrucomicrobiota bacterium]